ncbi:pantoate--beta-alanine ligase [Bacillus alkalicellulosilyticus]|uniref:pantoate--beta-alanine ligase n=1 Tax=Alkalihalobacterium alkalicellulosilyticum TaxID=1912214 RepID=UPI0014826D35|nr:pantoate--beta-alanine ligase [Bacillus alkalicellulosilyticus]
MKIVETILELQQQIPNGKTVGFVPTMGFLHEGHLSLVQQAKKECDLVVMSIFVNPLQFGPNEDFDRYPRNFERDCLLAEQEGVDFLFYPTVKEMYPVQPALTVKVHEGVDVLCGKSRPGHFDGVATVVLKLLQIVSPERAYFGLKDAQQVAAIEKLIRDFHLRVTLVGCPTLREHDGLAKSSRNVNLTRSERENASNLYQSLLLGKQVVEAGEYRSQKVLSVIEEFVRKNVTGTVDYIEVLSYPELGEIEHLSGRCILAIAVQYSKARLIDNIILDVKGEF